MPRGRLQVVEVDADQAVDAVGKLGVDVEAEKVHPPRLANIGVLFVQRWNAKSELLQVAP